MLNNLLKFTSLFNGLYLPKHVCCGSCAETYHSYEPNITLLTTKQTKKN